MNKRAKAKAALLALVAVLSVIACFFIVRGGCRDKFSESTNIIMGWDAKKQLDFAETLASKGLKKEALTAFDDYLKVARISAIEAAKLLYRMGNINMELFDYERALYYFYKAETVDPSAGFKSELDRKLVECLENLGMVSQARHEISQRVSLGDEPKKSASNSAVFAKVGDEEITEAEINEAIDAMPEWARENFASGEGKVEFVRQYAATQALYKKAKMMGLEQDEVIKRNLRDIAKKLLVQKFLENQLKDKVSAAASDMETYYEANKERYKEPAAANISMIKISDEKKAQDAARRLGVGADFPKMASELSEDDATKAKGGLVEVDIEPASEIPGVGFSKEASSAIFLKKNNEIAGPVKIKDAYYIFRINKIVPQKQLSFAEAKDQVEYEYKNKKIQEQMQALLNNILQEQQVEIYTDRILGKEIPVEQKPEQPEQNQNETKPAEVKKE